MATITRFPQSYYDAGLDSDIVFNNPTNAYADDGSYMTAVTTKRSSSDYITYYNFACGIPTGSTINSITMEVQWKVSTTASILSMDASLRRSDVQQGSSITNSSEPTTDTTENTSSVGTWTVAQLNDNTLATGPCIRIFIDRGATNTNGDVLVDYVKLTIDYSPGTQTVTPNAFDNSNTIGSPTVTADRAIAANLFDNAQSFGTPSAKTVIYINQLANNNLMGAPQIALGVVPSLFGNSQSFGTPVVANLLDIIEPNALNNSQSFGTPALVISLSPASVINTSDILAPTLAQNIFASSYSSSNVLPLPVVTSDSILLPDALDNIGIVGSPTVVYYSSTKYPKFKEELLNGNIDLLSDSIKMVLIDTGVYTYSPNHQYYSNLSGIKSAGVALTGRTVLNGVFDADAVLFAGVSSATIGAVVIYKDTGVPSTSALIAYIDNSADFPISTVYDNVTINIGATGIFQL